MLNTTCWQLCRTPVTAPVAAPVRASLYHMIMTFSALFQQCVSSKHVYRKSTSSVSKWHYKRQSLQWYDRTHLANVSRRLFFNHYFQCVLNVLILHMISRPPNVIWESLLRQLFLLKHRKDKSMLLKGTLHNWTGGREQLALKDAWCREKQQKRLSQRTKRPSIS